MMSQLLRQIRLFIPIFIGTAIYAFGLHYFLLPNQLMEGGVTGIAVLLNYALNWPLSISTLLLNIPIFFIGWKMLGIKQMMYTLFGILSLSACLAVMEWLIEQHYLIPFQTTSDYMLSALYAGVVLGAGLGIVFRFGGTTGGVDIIARILTRATGISMGQIILSLDVVIIGISLLYIPINKVLYTLVMVFIASKLIDFIQDGAYSAKAFSIITEHGEQIAEEIARDLERGVTLMPAKGAYSGKQKEVVYCVVQRQEIRRMRSIVRKIDPRAFIVITEVHDVLGEGFKDA